MKINSQTHAFMLLAVLVGVGLLRFWLAPSLNKIPADYSSTVQFLVENRFRESPDGEWHSSVLNVIRSDHAIKATDKVAMIEGSMQAYFENGELNFETRGLYGVDRRTRMNISGYGNIDRTGQYFFPTHVKRIDYAIWDPMFIGQRQATFEGVEMIDGIQIYVFRFQANGMDETEGYSYLRDVPDRFRVNTDGHGVIWVEPLSGIIVNYSDGGESYFVDPETDRRLASFNQWEEQYSPDTRTTQLHLAKSVRNRMQLRETWIPGLVIIFGVVWIWLSRSNRKQSKDVLSREQVLEKGV